MNTLNLSLVRCLLALLGHFSNPFFPLKCHFFPKGKCFGRKVLKPTIAFNDLIKNAWEFGHMCGAVRRKNDDDYDCFYFLRE